MQPIKQTITRLVPIDGRSYAPQQFDVVIDLSKIDATVFIKAMRQVRVMGMGGAIQVVKSKKLVGVRP
jgi:hypothetical protein